MRLLKIPLFILAMIIALSSVTNAQIINCDAIGESPVDSVRIISQFIKPGEIASIPIYLRNDEFGVGQFQLYLEFDSTLLRPIIIGVDSLYDDSGDFTGQTQNLLDYTVTGRFLKSETKFDSLGFPYLDTTTNVQVVTELDFPSPLSNLQRIKIVGSFRDLFTPENIIAQGADVIMHLLFEVNPNAVQNTLSTFDFYAETIVTRDTAFPYDIIRTDCLYSRFGDSTGTVDRRLTIVPGTLKVDTSSTGNPPTITSFAANPSTIDLGQSSTLSWDVLGADSVVISNGVGSSTSTLGSAIVTPSSTTTYTITAYNVHGSVSAAASVVVNTGGGGGGDNNNPVVGSINGSPFSISQGETVTFSVTATDADASDIITLTATTLPNNASFSDVVGSGSVTGSFSFTPDFTQSGSQVVTFRATDNQGGSSNSLSVIINVEEIQNDRLFTTSNIGQRPVGGLKGKEAVYFPINLVTSQTVYGVQFDFVYDPLFFEVDSFIVTGRTVDYVIYDDIGTTPGRIKVLAFGLDNEPVVNVPDTTAILYAVLTIDSAALPGNYPVYFEDGWESVNPDPAFPSLALVVDSGIIQVDSPGDVNLDQRIDVADLVNVVASILNNYILSQRQFDVADVITTDTVDVFDLVGIVNMIFNLPLMPNPSPEFEGETGTIALAYGDLQQGGSETLVVNSEIPVDIAAVELEIEYDPTAVTLGKPILNVGSNMTVRYKDNKAGKMKVLIHFDNPYAGQLIQSGNVDLLDIPMIARDDIVSGDKNQLKIVKANFSTAQAARVVVEGVDAPGPLPASFLLSQNYPNPFNPTTRIDFSLGSNQQVALAVYNILGQHVITLIDGEMPAGSYTVEWDATGQNGQTVATGIYLYRLHVGVNSESKKMLFLK